MSDLSPNNNEKQKSRKCLIWGSLAFIMASSTIGGAYYLSSIANATTEVARLLAEEKTNVNTKDSISTPSLSETANDSQTEAEEIPVDAVKMPLGVAEDGLKERGIDVDWVRREDWESAVDKQDVEMLHYLIVVESEKKLVMNTHCILNSLLLRVSAKGDIKIVKYLIEKGANVNASDEFGWTPLTHAASGGHTETAKLLIKEGADVNKANNSGQTPLHAAASGNHTETAKLLIEAWADINYADNKGWTPLHVAEYKKAYAMKQLLIEKGADEARETNKGRKYYSYGLDLEL